MESSSNLSQSMDSVNTVPGEEEVGRIKGKTSLSQKFCMIPVNGNVKSYLQLLGSHLFDTLDFVVGLEVHLRDR